MFLTFGRVLDGRQAESLFIHINLCRTEETNTWPVTKFALFVTHDSIIVQYGAFNLHSFLALKE